MVPAGHPLRQIRPLVNTALARLSPEFDQLYALTGRPSIPPEQYASRLFSIVDYFSTRPRMPTQADRSGIDSIGSLLAWMLNPLIKMILMHPGGGEQLLWRGDRLWQVLRRLLTIGLTLLPGLVLFVMFALGGTGGQGIKYGPPPLARLLAVVLGDPFAPIGRSTALVSLGLGLMLGFLALSGAVASFG